MTGPESVVLPLHHSPMLKCDAKVQLFFVKQTILLFFCLKKLKITAFYIFKPKKHVYLYYYYKVRHFVIQSSAKPFGIDFVDVSLEERRAGNGERGTESGDLRTENGELRTEN